MSLKSAFSALIIVTTVAGAQTQAAAPKVPRKAASAASYKKELPAKLLARTKVAEPAAATTALGKVPGGSIKGVELEEEGGKLIYSYDIAVAGKSGIDEVNVDAVTGSVVAVSHEDAASEKKETAQDAAKGTPKSTKSAPRKPPVAPVKKP